MNRYPIINLPILLLIYSSLISRTFAQTSFDCSQSIPCVDVQCAEGTNCTVLCSETSSCNNAAINAPNNGNLTVTCALTDSCINTAINAAVNGNILLQCIYDNACSGITLNALNMTSGGVVVHNAASSTIQCPGNALECVVHCSLNGGCANTIFNTDNDTAALLITASAAAALKESTIHCPEGGICSITMEGAISDTLSDARIYSSTGLENVSIICNYSTDLSECYDELYLPRLWCKSDGSVVCNIHLADGYDVWHCPGFAIGEFCNENRANGWYGSHIMCDDVNECRSHEIFCTEGEDCTLLCYGYKSCRGVIHAPNNANLTMKCDIGHNICMDAVIHGAINGNVLLMCGAGTTNLHSCRGITVNCPIHGLCEVHNVVASTVNCPGNTLQCIIQCSISNGCEDTTFYTQNDTALIITASATGSLKGSHIHCVKDSVCSIIADGSISGTLSDAHIHSSNGLENVSIICNYVNDISECYDELYLPQLWCKSDYSAKCSIYLSEGNDVWQCKDFEMTQLCDETTTAGYYGSHIMCDDSAECRSDDLFCSEGVDCNIFCFGWKSCRESIYAPNNANLTMKCTAENACDNAIIYGANNGNVLLECYTNRHACGYIALHGPVHGNVLVQCNEWMGCDYFTLDALNMASGSVVVYNTGNAVINCPGNGLQCIAYCDGVTNSYRACQSTTFNTQSDTASLMITASGSQSLKSSKIYCPINGECSIIMEDSVSDTLTSAQIYSNKGLLDISMICNYSLDSSECYDALNPPKLFCKPDFSASCDIELQSGSIHQWECIGTDTVSSVCDNPTQDPTREPTMIPTQYPTIIPTQYPSIDPTKAPSTDPTPSPTQYSTIIPTQYPTMIPTQYPSIDPTKAPSTDPTPSPTIQEEERRDQTINEESFEDIYIKEDMLSSWKMLIIIGSLALVILCFSVGCGYMLWQNRKLKIHHKNMTDEVAEAGDSQNKSNAQPYVADPKDALEMNNPPGSVHQPAAAKNDNVNDDDDDDHENDDLWDNIPPSVTPQTDGATTRF